MRKPFLYRLVDAQDRHVRRRDHDAVLDGVKDPGKKLLLLADGCVGLREGLFLLFPLDGGAEVFRCSPRGAISSSLH